VPAKAATGCREPGCPNSRPCPSHPLGWTEGGRGRTMPPGWTATRSRILKRDGHRCRGWCAGNPATEVHHLIPGVEDDAYLLSLCHDCHAAITSAQAQQARGLVPRAQLLQLGTAPLVPMGVAGQAPPPPGGHRPAQGLGGKVPPSSGGVPPPRPGASGSRSCAAAKRRRFRPFSGSPPAANPSQVVSGAAWADLGPDAAGGWLWAAPPGTPAPPVLVSRPEMRPDRG
jgi:hypothetical protein